MAGLLKKLPWFRQPDEFIVSNRDFFKNFDQTRPLYGIF